MDLLAVALEIPDFPAVNTGANGLLLDVVGVSVGGAVFLEVPVAGAGFLEVPAVLGAGFLEVPDVVGVSVAGAGFLEVPDLLVVLAGLSASRAFIAEAVKFFFAGGPSFPKKEAFLLNFLPTSLTHGSIRML